MFYLPIKCPYLQPKAEVVELHAQQIICQSGDDVIPVENPFKNLEEHDI